MLVTSAHRLNVAGVAVLVGLLSAIAPARAHGQARVEVLRGTVTSDSGMPLPGALVTATMAPDREQFTTRSGVDGKWEIRVPNGTGDYLVAVIFIGRVPIRRRITRVGDQTEFVVDVALRNAALPPGVQAMQAVRVQAQRPRPSRGPESGSTTGSSEKMVDGVNGALAPDEIGNINATAAQTPGVAADGSVLGLSASQNQTTLGGMAFAGTDLPRGVPTQTRVSSSAYDPARGGFSGAQMQVDLSPGRMFHQRGAFLTYDGPSFTLADRVAQRSGVPQSLRASMYANGELVENKYYYSTGLQYVRSTTDHTSLGGAGIDLLKPSGIAPDSAQRLLVLLAAAGIPIGASAAPTMTDDITLLARVDHTPNARQTWNVSAYGKVSAIDGIGVDPTSTGTHTMRSRSQLGALFGTYSTYFNEDWLNETRIAFTTGQGRTEPDLRLPDGRVLVSSDFADGTTAIAQLAFAGHGGGERDTAATTWEASNETQFYSSARATHKIKLYVQARLDAVRQQLLGNRSGTFSYNSLADFAANTPASFTRLVSAAERTARQWAGAIAIGDLWRPKPNFQVQYGLRAEANSFSDGPRDNPAVFTQFGVHTSAEPNSVHVSPRLGFSWNYGGGPASGMRGMTMGPVGTQIIGLSGLIRGGIGEFRSLIPTGLVATTTGTTGLPNGEQRISCVGSATPIPSWSGYAANPSGIPETCVGGASQLGDIAPSVTLFDRDWAPPRSWRANLGWLTRVSSVSVSVEAIGSLNYDQPGIVDLNFAGTPRFWLADEGDRPVYVNPSSIVPASGAVSPVDSRKSAAFGRVALRRSDLESWSRRLTVVLTPDMYNWPVFVSVAYTLGDVRALARGFDGAGAADPRTLEWARANGDVRHMVQLQGGFARRGFSISGSARIESPQPFTPLVAGDINGDGLFGNDRAFIFNPATAPDPAVATALQSLLTSAPSGVQACLQRQMGTIAERGSCEGPWTATLNARLGYSASLPVVGRRVQLAVNFANILAGLDLAAHGSSGLRGWGAPALPDPTLYTVRGFDPGTNRFKYDVNPRFGSTSPAFTTYRAPFRISLDVTIDIGQPTNDQQIDRWLRPGRGGRSGTRLDADSLRKLYARGFPDMYRYLLQESDSLLLSKEQVDKLQEAQNAFRVRTDSAWTDLAGFLSRLPEEFRTSEVRAHVESRMDDIWEMCRQEAKRLDRFLSPVQLRLLPFPAGMLFNMKERPRGFRIFMG